jgi:hypothetical protein
VLLDGGDPSDDMDPIFLKDSQSPHDSEVDARWALELVHACVDGRSSPRPLTRPKRTLSVRAHCIPPHVTLDELSSLFEPRPIYWSAPIFHLSPDTGTGELRGSATLFFESGEARKQALSHAYHTVGTFKQTFVTALVESERDRAAFRAFFEQFGTVQSVRDVSKAAGRCVRVCVCDVSQRFALSGAEEDPEASIRRHFCQLGSPTSGAYVLFLVPILLLVVVSWMRRWQFLEAAAARATWPTTPIQCKYSKSRTCEVRPAAMTSQLTIRVGAGDVVNLHVQ